MDYRFRFDVVTTNIGFLMDGLGMTLLISFLALVVSTVIGCSSRCAADRERAGSASPAATYCELFRDTPVLVQLFWVYYVLPVLTGVRLSAFAAVVIGLSLNSGVFLAEIFRAGPGGTARPDRRRPGPRHETHPHHAADRAAPGHPHRAAADGQRLRGAHQVLVLASTFAVGEITRKATELSSFTFRPIEIFTFIALVYFFICWPLSMSIRYLERRLQVT